MITVSIILYSWKFAWELNFVFVKNYTQKFPAIQYNDVCAFIYTDEENVCDHSGSQRQQGMYISINEVNPHWNCIIIN